MFIVFFLHYHVPLIALGDFIIGKMQIEFVELDHNSSEYSEITGMTMYKFDFVVMFLNKSSITSKLRLFVPGDVRLQIDMYCHQNGFQIHNCEDIKIAVVNNYLPQGSHMRTTTHQCDIIPMPGCRRNGLKVAIIQLATANAH